MDPAYDRRWQDALAHRERLLKIARARTPSREDAEDIVQEALLRCAEFEDLDEQRLGRFLTSVTIRLCIDEHRRRTQAARLGLRLEAEPTVAPGSDERVCDRAEAAWVADLVAELPPRQRDVLAAKAEGLSCAEIGNRYRMSYKAVESALSHARKAVRAALAAASCAVGAVAVRLGWRSRSVAIVAAPVAAVTLTLGLQQIIGGSYGPGGGGSSGGERAAREFLRVGEGDARGGGAPVPGPQHSPRPRPSHGQDAPDYANVDVGGHKVRVGPSGSPPPFDPVAYASMCANDGVTVRAGFEPDDPIPKAYQGCGPTK